MSSTSETACQICSMFANSVSPAAYPDEISIPSGMGSPPVMSCFIILAPFAGFSSFSDPTAFCCYVPAPFWYPVCSSKLFRRSVSSRLATSEVLTSPPRA